MPDPLRKQTLGCSISGRSIFGHSISGGSTLGGTARRWLVACAVWLAAIPTLSWAESLPASVRACAGEMNADTRLACYDKEVGRFLVPGEKSVTKTTSGAAGATASTGGTPTPATSNTGAPATASGSASTRATPPPPSNTGAPSTATPAAGSESVAPPATTAATSGSTSDDAKHFTAHVLSIERIPNEMILHLDNGQVWQEVQSVPGDLSLRDGDAVKIDKHFGSYWLSGPHVSSMKVRQKS
jgi:hypothetical protein